MSAFLARLMPNVVDLRDYLFKAVGETFIMVSISGVIGITLGILSGVVLVITREDGLYPNRALHDVLDKVVNVVRSIPFVILIALLVSFTRLIVGTSIGVRGAIVPMVIGIIPITSRLTEQTLLEIDPGVIEAAQAMGISRGYIVTHIMIPESRPGLIRTLVTCIISLIGLSAMAGTVGGGGVGNFAIRYGYNRFMTDITIVTVVFLLIVVNAIQSAGNHIAAKMTH